MGFIIEFLKCENSFTPIVSLHLSWKNAIWKFRLWQFSCRTHGMNYSDYSIDSPCLQDIALEQAHLLLPFLGIS